MPVGLIYRLLRAGLFTLPPEWAHAIALHGLNWLSCRPAALNQAVGISQMGLSFPNRIGLAAGLDKNGKFLKGLSTLPFGFIEVGTVTPHPQVGSPKPRLFRLPSAHALINRMGLNNEGVDCLVKRVSAYAYRGILGINIGKNQATPLDQAVNDYLICFEKVYPVADYVALNLSSPNTPALRQLQHGAYFSDLLNALTQAQARLSDNHQRIVPLVVKCSPDESIETLSALVKMVLKYKIAGIIATNTTITRPGLAGIEVAKEAGGLSGRPLFESATQTLRFLKQEAGDAVTLIASGGIEDQQTALLKLKAGASLLQLYTGLIYQGPALVKQLVHCVTDALH